MNSQTYASMILTSNGFDRLIAENQKKLMTVAKALMAVGLVLLGIGLFYMAGASKESVDYYNAPSCMSYGTDMTLPPCTTDIVEVYQKSMFPRAPFGNYNFTLFQHLYQCIWRQLYPFLAPFLHCWYGSSQIPAKCPSVIWSHISRCCGLPIYASACF